LNNILYGARPQNVSVPFSFRFILNGRSRAHKLLKTFLNRFRQFCRFPKKIVPYLWRHLETFRYSQFIENGLSFLKEKDENGIQIDLKMPTLFFMTGCRGA